LYIWQWAQVVSRRTWWHISNNSGIIMTLP
jgi:hypothetical protein